MRFLAFLAWGCGGAPAPEAASPAEAPVAAAEAPPAGGHGAHGPGHAAHGDHATMSHRFDDPERWSQVFDDPARDAWQKPAELVAALAIPPGAVVADVGAGTGYLEPHLARAVGPEGRVIAVDVEPALVAHLRARAAKEGLANVEARQGEAADPKLGPEEADLVILLDTYHHVDGRVAWFDRLRTAVDPAGRLVIVDFDPASEDDHGPPRDHRLAPEVVVAELTSAGWTVVERPAVLPHQYVIVAKRG